MTIVDALMDGALFGGLPAFRNLATWRAWLVFLRVIYGLPLAEDEQAIFCERTGRTLFDPPAGGRCEVVAVVGRQSGKTRVAATIAAFEAMMAPAEADQTETYALLIAPDARGALRALFAYVRAIFDGVPLLARSVATRRAETLTLHSGCTLAVYPCRPAAVQAGPVPVSSSVMSWRSIARQRVSRPISRCCEPYVRHWRRQAYAQTGALYDLHCKHFGRNGGNTLVWQASAPSMNPLLAAEHLTRMAEDDPEAYRSEVLGEFRAGVSTSLDPDAIAACVAEGLCERPPAPEISYVSFCDSSGGRRDMFTLGIAHREGSSLSRPRPETPFAPECRRRPPTGTTGGLDNNSAPVNQEVSMTIPKFNLDELRLSQDFAGHVGVKRALLTVPVRKPGRQDFVRVHPDPAYRIETEVLQFKDDREIFMVAPAIRHELLGELVPVVLFTTITRQGIVFLWPVRLPGPDGRHDAWNRSALEGAELAMGRWVRLASNRALGAYEIFEATGVLADPEWPAEDFNHIFGVAFKDHYIDSADHSAVRRLRGEL
jgi:hypothetical protein